MNEEINHERYEEILKKENLRLTKIKEETELIIKKYNMIFATYKMKFFILFYFIISIIFN